MAACAILMEPMADDAALPIVMCGDPILRRPAGTVPSAEIGTPELMHLVAQMRATMRDAPGVGLAAPQVGVPLRVAVMEDGPQYWGSLTEDDLRARDRGTLAFTVMVNPILTPITSSGEDGPSAAFFEGCLSVPGLTGVVRRYRSVRVEAVDEEGTAFSRVYSGWAARIVQHELDHLAGALYLDRVEPRSLSTVENYARHWARTSPAHAAEALGFSL